MVEYDAARTVRGSTSPGAYRLYFPKDNISCWFSLPDSTISFIKSTTKRRGGARAPKEEVQAALRVLQAERGGGDDEGEADE